MNDYMQHFGIKGMHWGRRKASPASNVKSQKKASTKKDDKPFDYAGAKTKLGAASTIVNEGKKIDSHMSTRHEKQVRSQRADLSFVDDAELKKIVARMTMEKQYNQLKAEQQLSGKNHVKSILDATGTLLVLGTSAVAMAEAIGRMSAAKKVG